MVFILAMPAVMLVLLGAIFGEQHDGTGVTIGDLYVAGLIGGGVMATSYQNLGMSIAFERERFTLKRLRGTPMPAAAYFTGKIIQVLVAGLAEVALLLAVGLAFYHLRLPTSLAAWWTFTWVFVLGVAACSLLGIAASSVPRSAARNGVAVITFPFVVLQFISGVYVPFFLVPAWLRDIASVFPLEWMCRGMRSVFVPAGGRPWSRGQSWQHGQTALVLAAWIVAGLVLCLTTFRWQNRQDTMSSAARSPAARRAGPAARLGDRQPGLGRLLPGRLRRRPGHRADQHARLDGGGGRGDGRAHPLVPAGRPAAVDRRAAGPASARRSTSSGCSCCSASRRARIPRSGSWPSRSPRSSSASSTTGWPCGWASR